MRYTQFSRVHIVCIIHEFRYFPFDRHWTPPPFLFRDMYHSSEMLFAKGDEVFEKRIA